MGYRGDNCWWCGFELPLLFTEENPLGFTEKEQEELFEAHMAAECLDVNAYHAGGSIKPGRAPEQESHTRALVRAGLERQIGALPFPVE